jgi:hypothetical protein
MCPGASFAWAASNKRGHPGVLTGGLAGAQRGGGGFYEPMNMPIDQGPASWNLECPRMSR